MYVCIYISVVEHSVKLVWVSYSNNATPTTLVVVWALWPHTALRSLDVRIHIYILLYTLYIIIHIYIYIYIYITCRSICYVIYVMLLCFGIEYSTRMILYSILVINTFIYLSIYIYIYIYIYIHYSWSPVKVQSVQFSCWLRKTWCRHHILHAVAHGVESTISSPCHITCLL